MAIAKGTRLGHYEVLNLIGEGGMGEVYRAHDTKLAREVALKVLPEAFASDPDRVERFKREARLLASLNHTNIAAIYGMEDSGETRFLVMELVEGDTLRDQIARDGPAPLDEALKICSQIVEAMEAAHEKPIIHRDLKPANIKVTPEGTVKVLDFGLAKAFADESASGDPSDSPTLSALPTQPGTILGTASYMSPEQARGKKVDRRTDIWAFGCVLYELLSGKQAFSGEDVTEIIAAVVKGEPDWQALPPETPANIRIVLRRCLEKDVKRRFHAAADVRIGMEETLPAPAPAVPPPVAAVPPLPRWRRAAPVAAAVLVGALLASAGLWSLWRSGAPTARSPKRFVISLPATEQLVNEGLALSPDGKTLVYIGQRGAVAQLFRRSMDQLEALPIPGTEGAQVPFFSPDSQWVGFFAGDKLKKVSLAGGPPAALCNVVTANRSGASWGTDDTIIFGVVGSGLLRVPAAGGTPQQLTTPDASRGESLHRWPDILPGSEAFLFTVFSAGLDTAQIAVESLKTGQRRVLLAGSNPRFVPTGHILFAREGSLWAVPFDSERLELTGSPAPLLEGIQVNSGGLAHFAPASDGSLVYIPGAVGRQRQLVWVDRKGAAQPLPAPPRTYVWPRLSPDGRRAVTQINEAKSDIWLYDLARDTLTRLTFEGNNTAPYWTPDGKRIVFASNKAGAANLFWKPADGSGPEERLTTSEYTQTAGSFAPDGRSLVYTEQHPKTGRDLWVLPLEAERKPRVFLQTPFNEATGRFSPDGRWLAYLSDESGRYEVYVRPFPGPGGKYQISTEGGNEIVWGENGELFYRTGGQREKMMAVETQTQPTFSAGKPRQLFEGAYYYPGGVGASYSVSPDGQRFLMLQEGQQQEGAPSQIHVVLDWFEELKRKVPSGR